MSYTLVGDAHRNVLEEASLETVFSIAQLASKEVHNPKRRTRAEVDQMIRVIDDQFNNIRSMESLVKEAEREQVRAINTLRPERLYLEGISGSYVSCNDLIDAIKEVNPRIIYLDENNPFYNIMHMHRRKFENPLLQSMRELVWLYRLRKNGEGVIIVGKSHLEAVQLLLEGFEEKVELWKP